MKTKVNLKHEVPLPQQSTSEECCVPECGPETCGGENNLVSMDRLNKPKTNMEGCCEPDCGPDTCGT
ncbi:hypothetical protein JYT31_00060 [Beggiatoa alba]|nr:hypothetical protein [Beggiatoa alba]